MECNLETIEKALPEILTWYSASRRMLPWRRDPSPYHIWISEIMLQQTRIETVIPYYERFLEAFPDIPSLANAEEDQLLKLWEGLGYYSRARNLKKAAVQVMEHYNGLLPQNAEDLRKLAGIGPYTAGSIASIAYGQPEPAVDGNVLRVIMRLLRCSEDIALPGTRRRVTDLLRSFYPSGEKAGCLTEGLMELGETVCLPNGVPQCDRCPVHALCLAHRAGEELSYPCKSAGKERRVEERTVLLLSCRGKYALRKRPDSGLLAKMWEFPNFDGHLSPDEVRNILKEYGTTADDVHSCGQSRHIFSHIEWHMTGYRAGCTVESDRFLWKTPEEIRASCSIPSAFRAFQLMLN